MQPTVLQATGRAWVFGDEVNTDDMFPGFAMKLPYDEAAQYAFSASRPGWSAAVGNGDVVVGGRRFGIGSARPVALLLRRLGVTAVIAEEFNSLFLRNCMNYGLPAITLEEARARLPEGDEVGFDLATCEIVNRTQQRTYQIAPLPDFMLAILRSGGLVQKLEQEGLIRSE